ncbi:hypothetical protein A2U01_0080679, partial [Trifolium medium]|nr:hypothetical protein [Trifolium medium]
EQVKAEEEAKRRIEEEEKRRLEEEEKKLQEEQQKVLALNVSPKGKGKEIDDEPQSHPLMFVLQEQLEAHKVEQEKIKEEVKNLTEGQHNV